jgi:GrpB-like predicted nucleotidyltransferase (UPF0157 family)
MPSPTVTILEYQDQWRSDFELVASDLCAVLRDAALRVDHIGSTAIRGLCAKDIIDVQVTVPLLNDGIAQEMLQAGFTTHTDMWRQDHLPPGFQASHQDWNKLFFMQRPGARRTNIHIRQVGTPNQRYPLLVRDFLRQDACMAEAYGRLKNRLAAGLADPKTYPDVKDPVADLIYLAAERWAAHGNWHPLRMPSEA